LPWQADLDLWAACEDAVQQVVAGVQSPHGPALPELPAKDLAAGCIGAWVATPLVEQEAASRAVSEQLMRGGDVLKWGQKAAGAFADRYDRLSPVAQSRLRGLLAVLLKQPEAFAGPVGRLLRHVRGGKDCPALVAWMLRRVVPVVLQEAAAERSQVLVATVFLKLLEILPRNPNAVQPVCKLAATPGGQAAARQLGILGRQLAYRTESSPGNVIFGSGLPSPKILGRCVTPSEEAAILAGRSDSKLVQRHLRWVVQAAGLDDQRLVSLVCYATSVFGRDVVAPVFADVAELQEVIHAAPGSNNEGTQVKGDSSHLAQTPNNQGSGASGWSQRPAPPSKKQRLESKATADCETSLPSQPRLPPPRKPRMQAVTTLEERQPIGVSETFDLPPAGDPEATFAFLKRGTDLPRVAALVCGQFDGREPTPILRDPPQHLANLLVMAPNEAGPIAAALADAWPPFGLHLAHRAAVVRSGAAYAKYARVAAVGLTPGAVLGRDLAQVLPDATPGVASPFGGCFKDMLSGIVEGVFREIWDAEAALGVAQVAGEYATVASYQTLESVPTNNRAGMLLGSARCKTLWNDRRLADAPLALWKLAVVEEGAAGVPKWVPPVLAFLKEQAGVQASQAVQLIEARYVSA